MMKSYSIYFMTEEDGFNIDIQSANEEAFSLYLEILTCFGDIEGNYLKIAPEQQATDGLKSRLSRFFEQYADIYPVLNIMKSKILSLYCNEYFLILTYIPVETSEILSLKAHISALNEIGNTAELQSIFEDKMSFLDEFSEGFISKYNWSIPRNDRRTTIGNAKKENRCCRFCNQTMEDGVTFKKVAHAIPEGLGNKNIILSDECDNCNEFFGNSIEPTLIEYLDIYRVLLGVKGKDGNPKIKSNNGYMQVKENILFVESQNIERANDKEIKASLEIIKKFVPVKIYKALCKITLSTIDEEYVADLKNTVKWIMSDDKQELCLPKVAVNFIHSGSSKVPRIVNYVRRGGNSDIPHVVSEFRIGSFIYVYIIPFSKKDTVDFTVDAEYENFWHTFKHYSSIDGWSFDCLSNINEVTVNENIWLVPNEKLQ